MHFLRFSSFSPPFCFRAKIVLNYELSSTDNSHCVYCWVQDVKSSVTTTHVTGSNISRRTSLLLLTSCSSRRALKQRVRDIFVENRNDRWETYKLLQCRTVWLFPVYVTMILIVYAGRARKMAVLTGRQILHRLGKNSNVLLFYLKVPFVNFDNLLRFSSSQYWKPASPWV